MRPRCGSVTGGGAYGKQLIIPAIGLHRFVPQPGGGWDLDLTATLTPQVGFTAVVPVPNPNGQGFFNWNPAGESVTLAPQGNGTFDLLDKLVDRARN